MDVFERKVGFRREKGGCYHKKSEKSNKFKEEKSNKDMAEEFRGYAISFFFLTIGLLFVNVWFGVSVVPIGGSLEIDVLSSIYFFAIFTIIFGILWSLPDKKRKRRRRK